MRNKTFVKAMIITAILSSIAFILLMIVGIRYVTGPKPQQQKTQTEVVTNIQTQGEVALMLGRVESLESEGLLLFDFDESRYQEVVPTKITQIKDRYGKDIPLNSLQIGDIVQVTYDEEKDRILSISKQDVSWVKSNIEQIDIDTNAKKLYLSNESCTYTLDTMVLDEKGEKTNIYSVGKYDTLELIGIGENVYTIKVLKKQGQIELMNMPLAEGLIEINTSRQINLEQVSGPIPVQAGKHKLVIKMKGYETIIKEVVVEQGEMLQVNLEEAELAYTEILIETLNYVESYKVEVDGNTFYKGEPIKVKQGTYLLRVSADGFVDWLGNITLKEEKIRLQITLQPKEEEKEEDNESQQAPRSDHTSTQTGQQGTSSGVGNQHTVNISTDPEGATLYINGENKGKTPFTTTLEVGAYSVFLQKEGYEDYTSSIIIDNSDDQNSHLYILNPK